MTHAMIVFLMMVGVSLGGVMQAGLVLLDVRVPRLLRMAHGTAALLALSLLGVANLQGPVHPLAWWAFGVWTIGLAGGVLFFRVLFPGRPPRLLVLGHGALGLTGLVLLSPVAFAGG